MKLLSTSALLIGVATFSAAAMSAAPAQAGLFDFLFGRPQPQPTYAYPQYVPGDQPLEMRVSPRRRVERVRRDEERRPRKLATPIDPVKNPQWYLEDNTLRRGDIVVLKTGAFVFSGSNGGLNEKEDFAALKTSRMVSKRERDRVTAMVGKQNTTTVENEIIPTTSPSAAIAKDGAKEARLAQ